MDGKCVTGRQTRREVNRGRPKLICLDDVKMDLRNMGLKVWIIAALKRA